MYLNRFELAACSAEESYKEILKQMFLENIEGMLLSVYHSQITVWLLSKLDISYSKVQILLCFTDLVYFDSCNSWFHHGPNEATLSYEAS